jgi:branched-chain amino acid transport system substrate-binding protein
MVFDRYLVRVKRPEESRGPWDYLSIVSKVSAADAFRPLADSVCPFVKA